jgi:hypothetical protein
VRDPHGRDAVCGVRETFRTEKDFGKKFKIRASRLMQTTILECDQALERIRRKPAEGAQEKNSKFDRAKCCKRQFLSAINPLHGAGQELACRAVRDLYKSWSQGAKAFPGSRQIDRRAG